MRRTVAVLVAAVFGAGQAAAQAPGSLPFEEIDAAIARGAKAKECDVVVKLARPFGSTVGFDVVLMGPLNRIECRASSAARRYMTYTRDSALGIEPDVLVLRADPVKPVFANGRWNVTSPATHVVIFGGDGKDGAPPIQPDSVETFPAEWSNAVGGKFESGGISARFKLAKLPEGEFTVVIISGDDERRTKVGKKERPRIQ